MTIRTAYNIFVISIFLSAFYAQEVKAQSGTEQAGFKIGVSTNIGIATGSSPFGYGLGVDLILKYNLTPELSVTAAVGYARLLTKDTSPIADYDFIPAKASVRVFPIYENIYLEALAGAGFGIQDGSKTSFIFGGGIGYQWSRGYDLGIRYEGYQQASSAANYHPLHGRFLLAFGYYF